MAYKRNPMRCERACSLARHLFTLYQNTLMTASVQWFERTLDDSANKRIAVSEAFLAADAILDIMRGVCDGLVVYPKMISRRVAFELPFMAAENILMSAVKKGGDRQELHERLRLHSMEAGRRIKEEGLDNDLIGRVAADPAFGLNREELGVILDPAAFTGLSAKQTEDFVRNTVKPVLERFDGKITKAPQLKV